MGVEFLRLLKYEAEASFATENGSHTWTDLRAVDPQITTAQMMHDLSENRQRITTGLSQVLGRRSEGSRLGFGLYLRGAYTALVSGATAVDDDLRKMLKLSLGGDDTGEGTVTVSGCTTTVIKVAAGRGAQFSAGQAIMVQDAGGTGVNQISIIESISTDDLTLKIALSNAVAAGKTVWNSITTYVDPSATATGQFQALGDDEADIWLLLGVVGGLTFQNILSIQDLPRALFDFFVSKWEKDSGTLAAGSFSSGDLLGTTEAMEIHWQDHGTSTRNLISCSQLDVVPGVTWTALNARGNGDTEQVDRIRMTGCAPTATLTADPAAALWTAFSAKTAKHLTIMFGRTAGSSWCIELPKVRISAAPPRGAHAEQIATQLQLRAFEDDCGAGTSALERSPIRIHRL